MTERYRLPKLLGVALSGGFGGFVFYIWQLWAGIGNHGDKWWAVPVAILLGVASGIIFVFLVTVDERDGLRMAALALLAGVFWEPALQTSSIYVSTERERTFIAEGVKAMDEAADLASSFTGEAAQVSAIREAITRAEMAATNVDSLEGLHRILDGGYAQIRSLVNADELTRLAPTLSSTYSILPHDPVDLAPHPEAAQWPRPRSPFAAGSVGLPPDRVPVPSPTQLILPWEPPSSDTIVDVAPDSLVVDTRASGVHWFRFVADHAGWLVVTISGATSDNGVAVSVGCARREACTDEMPLVQSETVSLAPPNSSGEARFTVLRGTYLVRVVNGSAEVPASVELRLSLRYVTPLPVSVAYQRVITAIESDEYTEDLNVVYTDGLTVRFFDEGFATALSLVGPNTDLRNTIINAVRQP